MAYEKSIQKTLHSQICPFIADMRDAIDAAIREGATDAARITMPRSHEIIITWWVREDGDK